MKRTILAVTVLAALFAVSAQANDLNWSGSNLITTINAMSKQAGVLNEGCATQKQELLMACNLDGGSFDVKKSKCSEPATGKYVEFRLSAPTCKLDHVIQGNSSLLYTYF